MAPTDLIQAHLMLADFAAVADGKLYVTGGGWTRARSSAVISAIGGVIIVPWRRLGGTIELNLMLVRGDGQTVLTQSAGGSAPFVATAVIAAGKPASLPRGASASAPFAASFIRPELENGSYAFTVQESAQGEIARLPFEIDP